MGLTAGGALRSWCMCSCSVVWALYSECSCVTANFRVLLGGQLCPVLLDDGLLLHVRLSCMHVSCAAGHFCPVQLLSVSGSAL